MSWRSKPDETVPEPPAQAPDDEVAQRLAELTHREVALRRVTEVVEQQRTRLEERERELAQSSSDAVVELERRLARAVRRAEDAEARIRELEQRTGAAPQSPTPAAPRPAEVAVQAPPPVAPRSPAVEQAPDEATYTLQRLERLVHEAQLRGDPQAEEWAVYLPLLREHAEPDGRLPAQFAALVDSIFAG